MTGPTITIELTAATALEFIKQYKVWDGYLTLPKSAAAIVAQLIENEITRKLEEHATAGLEDSYLLPGSANQKGGGG